MHAEIVNWRFPLKSASGENVPGNPGARTTRNFTHLAIGSWISKRYISNYIIYIYIYIMFSQTRPYYSASHVLLCTCATRYATRIDMLIQCIINIHSVYRIGVYLSCSRGIDDPPSASFRFTVRHCLRRSSDFFWLQYESKNGLIQNITIVYLRVAIAKFMYKQNNSVCNFPIWLSETYTSNMLIRRSPDNVYVEWMYSALKSFYILIFIVTKVNYDLITNMT